MLCRVRHAMIGSQPGIMHDPYELPKAHLSFVDRCACGAGRLPSDSEVEEGRQNSYWGNK